MEMTVNSDGTLGQSRIYRALVRNRAKLAYRSVAAWLQGAGASPPPLTAVAGLDAQLRMQDDIAQALKRQRQSKGALEFDTAENRAVYQAGVLVDLQPDPRNRAQELIEEFMIAANGVAAQLSTTAWPHLAAANPENSKAVGPDRAAGQGPRGQVA